MLQTMPQQGIVPLRGSRTNRLGRQRYMRRTLRQDERRMNDNAIFHRPLIIGVLPSGPHPRVKLWIGSRLHLLNDSFCLFGRDEEQFGSFGTAFGV